MGRVFSKLPTFSADYAGACSVLYDLNGIVVICDASGCMGTCLVLDEPRLSDRVSKIFSASIRERDVVLGIDKKLKRQVTESCGIFGGEFSALVGTPVPMVIGADLQGISKEIEKETGIPSFGISASGMKFYEDGQRKAYEALVETFVSRKEETIGDINVIGATPLDMWDKNQTDDFIDFLKSCGAVNPVVWGSNGKIREISGAAGAKLNIAVSVSAVKIVKKLHKMYGTPYLIGYPIGNKQSDIWKEKIRKAMSGEGTEETQEKTADKAEGKRALIIGEQVASCSLREMLKMELGYEQVDVCSFFEMEKELMETGDRKMVEEDELTEFLLHQEKYEMIIADPFFFALSPYMPKHTVYMPHTAVSSRAFWNESPNCFGEKGSLYFQYVLKK